MVHVIFTYDEQVKKWETVVVGCKTPTEARQAFSAVVLTCHELNPELLTKTLATPILSNDDPDECFMITPAV